MHNPIVKTASVPANGLCAELHNSGKHTSLRGWTVRRVIPVGPDRFLRDLAVHLRQLMSLKSCGCFVESLGFLAGLAHLRRLWTLLVQHKRTGRLKRTSTATRRAPSSVFLSQVFRTPTQPLLRPGSILLQLILPLGRLLLELHSQLLRVPLLHLGGMLPQLHLPFGRLPPELLSQPLHVPLLRLGGILPQLLLPLNCIPLELLN
mmetsp:Transcript_25275/g.58912  ORF Transcript_25275/g.58912 Transcript_25275/m.58912 type:complete len:205 (+) Transcript_25275:1100-1714(+)